MDKTNKIFGIGAHRTGTKSLVSALNMLGIKSAHWGNHSQEVLKGIKANNFKLRIFEEYDAFVDLPIPVIFKELDKNYPKSKFILTVRNVENWVRSVEGYIGKRKLNFEEYLFYKVWYFDRDVFIKRYLEHNKNVRNYFKDRPNDLLIIDICKWKFWKQYCSSLGLYKWDNWGRLCSFLHKDVPAAPFPLIYGK